MNETLYTAKELSEILKVSPRTIYALADRGEIESYTIGRSRRFLMPKKDEDKTNNDGERHL